MHNSTEKLNCFATLFYFFPVNEFLMMEINLAKVKEIVFNKNVSFYTNHFIHNARLQWGLGARLLVQDTGRQPTLQPYKLLCHK